jgi:hypothetical protein
LIADERALAGLTIAVQESTAAHLYAEANVTASRLVSCESLPATFESADAATDPVIDVNLGAGPALELMADVGAKGLETSAVRRGKVGYANRSGHV